MVFVSSIDEATYQIEVPSALSDGDFDIAIPELIKLSSYYGNKRSKNEDREIKNGRARKLFIVLSPKTLTSHEVA